MLRTIVLFAVLAFASAWQSAVASRALGSRPAVSMNTGYTDITQIGRKKNPNSGRSTALKGYTVGSFAPPLAKSSGSRITDMNTGYGIDNRWGGKQRAAAAPTSSGGGDLFFHEGTAGFVGDEAAFVYKIGLASK